MKVNQHKILRFIYIFLIVILFLVSTTDLIIASNFSASEYEINLDINYPQEIFSNNIDISLANFNGEISVNNNVYLEKFIIKNSNGKEIPFQYIKIETPYFKDTMDRSYRFLLMKKDQEKSWFRIGLISKTAYLDPGKYEGIINIDGLDWEINITVFVKPFVFLNLKENRFQFEITNAYQRDFFIAPNLYEIDIDYNYTDWEIQAALEQEAFLNQQGNLLSVENLYYRLERADQKNDLTELKQEQFTSFKENGMITIINGSDYHKGLTAIRFGVDLTGDNNFVQPAGLYSGKIIFTLKTLEDNNLWRSDDL